MNAQKWLTEVFWLLISRNSHRSVQNGRWTRWIIGELPCVNKTRVNYYENSQMTHRSLYWLLKAYNSSYDGLSYICAQNVRKHSLRQLSWALINEFWKFCWPFGVSNCFSYVQHFTQTHHKFCEKLRSVLSTEVSYDVCSEMYPGSFVNSSMLVAALWC